MNPTADMALFRQRLADLDISLHPRERCLALYSAAIAFADEPALSTAVTLARAHNISVDSLYELVLQSYLFLGFPRMLTAADHLARQYKMKRTPPPLRPISAQESEEWFNRGADLCRLVYAGNYDRLKNRVEEFAPEIFRWMICEGYGKVLSRPGLTIGERELAIVACLMIENRPAQLHSHLRGALNVGVDPALIRIVIDDTGPSSGDGYRSALELLEQLRIL